MHPSSSEDSFLPESVPNPSLEDLKDHYNSHNTNGNGSNRIKLRIPIEKRCVCEDRKETLPQSSGSASSSEAFQLELTPPTQILR